MFDESIYIPSSAKTTFEGYSCHLVRDNKIISFNTDTCIDSTCHLPVFVIYQPHYLVQYEDLVLTSDEYSSLMTSCSYETYNSYTTDVFYRYDLDSILISFIILLLICFFFPYKIISRLFGRWFKW